MHGFSPSDLRALLRHHHQAVISHLSAAHLSKIPVPGRAFAAQSLDRWSARALHLTIPQGTRLRRKAVVEHRRLLGEADITHLFGLRTTTAARTWLDLAAMAPLMDMHALVVAGDVVVNHAWVAGIGRTDPLTTVEGIRHAMVRAGRFAGIPADPWAPHADLGFMNWKIAIQYEGAHHRDRRQQEIDARRDEWFQAHGWVVINVTCADARQGLRRVIDRIHRHIAAATR